MGAWYWIGVATGVGVGAGIVIGALLPQGRPGAIAGLAAVLGVAAGIGIGLLVGGWGEAAGGGIGGFLGALSSVPIVAGAAPWRRDTLRRRRDRRSGGSGCCRARLRAGARLRGSRARAAVRPSNAAARRPALRGTANPRQGLTDEKLVLIVIDGLHSGRLRASGRERCAPSLSFLAGAGTYRRALSTFPSLTPVCASSIATGAHPDVHHIPHLVWYDREEGRLVEYGSSFGALSRAGTRRSILDTIFNMNGRHLSPDATTVFESLHDAGLTTAAVNFTCYRGRTEHRTVAARA